MAQPNIGHVFMSYSRRDNDVMWRIARFLRGKGIAVWVDNEKLIPGTPIWEEEIEKAIRAASAIVVIMSPDSRNSEWVRREITLADQFRKRIFPVLVSGGEETSITLRLITRQFVDFRENEKVGLNSLHGAVTQHLVDLKAQLDEQVRAEAEAIARAQAEREAAEKNVREQAWRETAEKAAREKSQREAVERSAREQAEREEKERIAKIKADKARLQATPKTTVKREDKQPEKIEVDKPQARVAPAPSKQNIRRMSSRPATTADHKKRLSQIPDARLPILVLGILLLVVFIVLAISNPSYKAKISATSTAGFNLTSTENAKSTGTAGAQATGTANTAATAIAGFEASAKLIYGPENGSLAHNVDSNSIPFGSAGVELENFIVEATFLNPYATETGSWDYGFLFRLRESNDYRLIIHSSGRWVLMGRINGNSSEIHSGDLDGLDLSKGGSNYVKVYCQGDKGLLYVNEKFVANLDLSALRVKGVVAVATGMSSGDAIKGSSTEYEDFAVWEIP